LSFPPFLVVRARLLVPIRRSERLLQNVGTTSLVAPSFSLEHLKHGDVFLIARIAFNQLQMHGLKAPLARNCDLFLGKSSFGLCHRFILADSTQKSGFVPLYIAPPAAP
jgi:hypothetical protein